MRKLNLSDVFRFSRMVKAAKAVDMVHGIMSRVDRITEDRARQIRDWEAELPGLEGQERAALVDRITSYKADDSWINDVGVDAVVRLMDCAAESGAEEAVYGFLAPILEMVPSDVGEMALPEFMEALGQIVAQNDLKSFFGSAQRML